MKQDVSQISPLNILGLGSLASSELLNSVPLTIGLWAALVLLGVCLLVIQRMYRFKVRVELQQRPARTHRRSMLPTQPYINQPHYSQPD
jgi:hypothetical protein